MTQNTQTTAERMRDYLERTVSWDNNHGDMEGYDEAAQTIAAEIDRLTAERGEARLAWTNEINIAEQAHRKAEAAQSALDEASEALAEARAEVERLRPAAEAWEAEEYRRAAGKVEIELSKGEWKRHAAAKEEG